MDPYSVKIYSIEFIPKLKDYICHFNKEFYYDKYLNIKEGGIQEIFEYYQKNSVIIDKEYSKILGNINVDYVKSMNDNNFSEKITQKIEVYKKNFHNNDNKNKSIIIHNNIYSELEIILDNSIKYFENLINSKNTIQKFYCGICDNNYLSEIIHVDDVQKDYKEYLEKIKIEENSEKEFYYFHKYVPEKVFNFKPFELNITFFHKSLKTDVFRKNITSIFQNLNKIYNTHLIVLNNFDEKPSHNLNITNFQQNKILYNNPYINKPEIDNLNNMIDLNSHLNKYYDYDFNKIYSEQNINQFLVTESKLTFEIINYYTFQEEIISNLSIKLSILDIANREKNKYLSADLPHENSIIITLKNFIDQHFGEAENYITAVFKSKKKELKKRISTNSLLPIFNIKKLNESERKFLDEIFPNESFPSYIIKDIKPNIPDKEVSNCKICQVKFGLIFKRKHHCRVCGDIYCDKCLIWSRVPFLGYLSRVRVCKNCVFTIKNELIEVILDDLINSLSSIDTYNSKYEKKNKKQKIFVLIGLLKRYCDENINSNFCKNNKWSFLGYELTSKLICGLSILCFKYAKITFEEWINLAIIFCKKALYKKAFKCLLQIKNNDFENMKNSEIIIFLYEKSEFFKFKSKEDFEIYGILFFFCYYLYLKIEENNEICILEKLMEKAYFLEKEQYYYLSKLINCFIRDQYLNTENKMLYENFIFAKSVKFLDSIQYDKNDFYFLSYFSILNIKLDSFLELLLKFLELNENLNLIKADIINKCINYFYPNVDLNYLDEKKYKKIMFFNLTKKEIHKDNPDFWLETFLINPDTNKEGDNMILILFLILFCKDLSLHDLSRKYLSEKKYDYVHLCNMIISISEHNKNQFLDTAENYFYKNKLYDETMICLYLSDLNFKKIGDNFCNKKLFDLGISCYYQLGFEKTVENVIDKLFDLDFEDFLFCNYSILKEGLNEKIKSILLTNIILSLKDNNKINELDYVLLLSKSIRIFKDYLNNIYIYNLHLLICESMIKENFNIAIGALHFVDKKNLDEYFKNKYEKTIFEFNKRYQEIIYEKLENGYINKEPLIYFVKILKQINFNRIEQAQKFYLNVKNKKYTKIMNKKSCYLDKIETSKKEKIKNLITKDDYFCLFKENNFNENCEKEDISINHEKLINSENNKNYILLKLLNAFKEKYMNNYKNSLNELFDVLLEFNDIEIYPILTDIFKTDDYYFNNSIILLINHYKNMRENLKLSKNKLNSSNYTISNFIIYENFIDISFPNKSRENQKQIINKNNLNKDYFENRMNIFNFLSSAFDYLDLTKYLDNDIDKAQTLLLSLIFFLKESNKGINTAYSNALRQIILDIIFNVFYIAKNYSTGITQIYFYKIILLLIFELLKDCKINFVENFIIMIKEIINSINIGYKYLPFLNENILSLENFSYLKNIQSNFLSYYLNGSYSENLISENKFFVFEQSRINNVFNKDSFNINTNNKENNNFALCLFELRNSLYIKNKIDLKNIDNFLKYNIINRDNSGFFSLDCENLNLPWDSFSVFHGFDIDLENKKIELKIEKKNESIFTMEDINEIIKNKFTEIFLSLISSKNNNSNNSNKNYDIDFPIETFYQLKYGPKNLHETNTLYTFFHVDYFLKMLCLGIEISANFPFVSKSANEGFLLKLPIDFRRKVEKIISVTKKNILFENKNPNIFIECEKVEYDFNIDLINDKIQFSISDPVFKFYSDNSKLLEELILFLNDNFYIFINYFPILKRFKELTKIMCSSRIIEELQLEQFLINTQNTLIENFLNEFYTVLPKLPSKYVYKFVTVMKSTTETRYNYEKGKTETITINVPVSEWQNVYDPTNYNKQLDLNIKEIKSKLRNKFNIEISDNINDHKNQNEFHKYIKKFCENVVNRFELLDLIIENIKTNKRKMINNCLIDIKNKFNSNSKENKIKKEIENEKIFYIPTGISNRENNSIIFGGIHIKPNLILNRGSMNYNLYKNTIKNYTI